MPSGILLVQSISLLISFTKGNKASQQLEQIHSKVAKANLADSFTTSTGESSSLILKNGKAGNFMNIIGMITSIIK